MSLVNDFIDDLSSSLPIRFKPVDVQNVSRILKSSVEKVKHTKSADKKSYFYTTKKKKSNQQSIRQQSNANQSSEQIYLLTGKSSKNSALYLCSKHISNIQLVLQTVF